jgi:transposase
MNASILDDEVWSAVSELVPGSKGRSSSEPGRRQLDGRATLSGILFVLMTGLPWNALPDRLGFGSGATCFRRLRAWQRAGAWQAIKGILIRKLDHADRIDWWRAEANAGDVRSIMRRRALARKIRGRRNRLVLIAR